MYSFLLDFLDTLNTPPSNIGRLIQQEKYVFRRKGYGTPEMKYLHEVFIHIQNAHPEFESISWEQSNQYNDNYDHFILNSFTVNDILYVESDISFYFSYEEGEEINSNISFEIYEYPDPIEIEYAKVNNIVIGEQGLENAYWDDYRQYRRKKFQPLEIPCLKFLTLLKLLERNYSMYYLLYTFGNGVEVKFNKEGVTVTKFDENDW